MHSLQKHMDISERKAVSIEVFWREVNQLYLLCRPCDLVIFVEAVLCSIYLFLLGMCFIRISH